MPRLSVEEVRKRADRAWELKWPWFHIFRECYELAGPGMDPYWASMVGHQRTPTSPYLNILYDSTLPRATQRLANRIHQDAFPAGRSWGLLTEGPTFAPDERAGSRRTGLVQAIQEAIYEPIHTSNFYLATHVMIIEGLITGTGVMKIGASPDPSQLVSFEVVPQFTVAMMPGPRGEVWEYHRKLWLSDAEIYSLWPQSGRTRTPFGEDGEEKRYTVYDSVYYDAFTGVWYYDVIVEDEGWHRIWQEDLLVSPWCVWRYGLMPGEVQGVSPVMMALPDTRTINEAIRIRLESASIRSSGVYTYLDDGVLNPATIRFEGGTFIPVASNANDQPSIRPLDFSGDTQLNELVIQDLRDAIQQTMLVNQLPPVTGPVRSATEIAERQREAMLALGGAYMRLTEEVGRPVLRAVAYELARKGHLPEVDAVVPTDENGNRMPLRLDGSDLGVKFSSPLVIAQALADADSILRWAEMSQVAAGPAAFQAGAKVEAIPEAIGRKLNVPDELIRPEGERAGQLQQAQGAAPVSLAGWPGSSPTAGGPTNMGEVA